MVRVQREYNAERRMTDFANHSSFCFEVLRRCDLCHLKPFERCIEFVAKHRQVVVKFLTCDFGVDLGGHPVLPLFAFISGRIALIFQNSFAFTSFFRNFAIEIARLLRLGKKKKRISFILLSTFRNFASETRKTMAKQDAIFRRSELLLGDEAMERIAQKRVIIFGVGGVGSWCAESLVRSGIRRLTIVDSDRVSITNINRQLMATTKTVGQVKVEALKERLLTINPSAEITALQKIFTEESASDFHLEDYDYIIDAIDSLKDKAALILLATSFPSTGENRRGPKLFSSMGAALKLDPTRIQITEFWKVKGDPLARALRNKFKKEKQFPKRKFQCVYSDELLANKRPIDPDDKGNGSIVHITAIFGFMLAGLVVQDANRLTA